jgi:histidinol-phosphate aminotransferase
LKFIRDGRPNVILLRTFSKIQGLAGLRIGYGLGGAGLVGILQKTRQPFNVNSIAQAGALAGLLDEDHQGRTRRINRAGKAQLEAGFADLGLEFVPSHANFILVRTGDGTALFKSMLRQGVIIRDMTGYGLPDWVRISIGTEPENARCLEVLRACLAG